MGNRMSDMSDANQEKSDANQEAAGEATPQSIVDQITSGDEDMDQILFLHKIAQQINKFEQNERSEYTERSEPTVSSMMLSPYSLSGEEQLQNGCIVRHFLRSFPQTKEGIPIGTPQIQSFLTPLIPLTTSKDSAYGIIAIGGLKSSYQYIDPGYVAPLIDQTNKDCFMIVKYSYEKDPVPFLYEIVLGMFINRLRYYIPNFMFTYSGLYCSPPVNLNRAYKNVMNPFRDGIGSKLEKMLLRFCQPYRFDKTKIVFGRFHSSVMKFIRSEGRYASLLKSEELQAILGDLLFVIRSELKNHQRRKELVNGGGSTSSSLETKQIKNKWGIEFIFTEIEAGFWNCFSKQLRETTPFARQLYSFLLYHRDEYKRLMKEQVSDFNPRLLCDLTRPSSVLILAERIPDSVKLKDWLERPGPFTPEEFQQIAKVWIQLLGSVGMAWNKLRFSHNDLHEKNILIRTLPEVTQIIYHIEVKTSEARDESRESSERESSERESSEPTNIVVPVETNILACIIDMGLAKVEHQNKTVGFTIHGRKHISSNTKDVSGIHSLFVRFVKMCEQRRYAVPMYFREWVKLDKFIRPKEQFCGEYYVEFFKIVSEFNVLSRLKQDEEK